MLYLCPFEANFNCKQYRIGLNEDSVTGSALCALAPYYFKKYDISQEKERITYLRGYQASQRGGEMKISLVGNTNCSSSNSTSNVGDRVLICGACVTIMHSEIHV